MTEPARCPGLTLAVRARNALEYAAREAAPSEACGCLIGPRDAAAWHVERALVGRNLARDRDHRFELHPGDVVRAEDEARADGLELLGFWHSHPAGRARPSTADGDMTWGDQPAVILSIGEDGSCEVRAWRRGPRGWLELPILFRSEVLRASPG